MKKTNIKSATSNALETIALKMAKAAANSKCVVVYHQPKIPDDIKKFRKF